MVFERAFRPVCNNLVCLTAGCLGHEANAFEGKCRCYGRLAKSSCESRDWLARGFGCILEAPSCPCDCCPRRVSDPASAWHRGAESKCRILQAGVGQLMRDGGALASLVRALLGYGAHLNHTRFRSTLNEHRSLIAGKRTQPPTSISFVLSQVTYSRGCFLLASGHQLSRTC